MKFGLFLLINVEGEKLWKVIYLGKNMVKLGDIVVFVDESDNLLIRFL